MKIRLRIIDTALVQALTVRAVGFSIPAPGEMVARQAVTLLLGAAASECGVGSFG
jgi:hypothetical protein